MRSSRPTGRAKGADGTEAVRASPLDLKIPHRLLRSRSVARARACRWSPTCTAPVLLIAMPQVLDPFFHTGVVLLLAHEEEGSFGFILNRPTGIRVAEILRGMEIAWKGEAGALAYFGGPVQPQLGTVLWAAPSGEPAGEGVTAGPAGSRRSPRASATCSSSPSGRRRPSACSSATPAGAPGSWWRRSCATTGSPRRCATTSCSAPRRSGCGTRRCVSVGVDPAALPSWTQSDDGAEGAN